MAEKTQSEIVYARLNELIAGGASLADAVRKVAKETGKTENAVRALRHNYMRKLGGGSGAAGRGKRGRRGSRPISADQAITEAKKLLTSALSAIDSELDAARAEVAAAQSRYDKLAASINERKRDLEHKIKALG